jgi:hypothetical protein
MGNKCSLCVLKWGRHVNVGSVILDRNRSLTRWLPMSACGPPNAHSDDGMTGSQHTHVLRRDSSRKWQENATIFHLCRKTGIVVVICPARFALASIAYNFYLEWPRNYRVRLLQRACRVVRLVCRATASAEAAALLCYLEQMWMTVAEVAEIVEKNKSHQPLGDGRVHLSSE